MPEKPIAFIFPAFVTEYPEDPFLGIPGLKVYRTYLRKAANSVDPELLNFNFSARNFLEDELRTQYMTYILCCAYADFLKTKDISPAICAGYSMGIYAAAYQAGSISFPDGLLLIRTAFLEIIRFTAGKRYGMGTVLGLTQEDIHKLMAEKSIVEVANQNNPVSFIFSGALEEVRSILDLALNEGALNIHLLNVSIPYHSKILEETKEPFGKFIESIPFKDPETPVMSMIDQSEITDAVTLKKEIVQNLYTPLNWYQTQLHLQNSGIRSFIECGPGKTLVKNAKFVEGDSRFYSLASLFVS